MAALSPHFTLAEMLETHHPALQTQPDADGLARLGLLCGAILEPVRAAAGPWGPAIGALHVDSGWRSAALNTAINGSPTTAHVYGCAADVRPLAPGIRAVDVLRAAWMLRQAGLLPLLDQAIIYDLDTPESPGSFVHLALARPGHIPRGQFRSTPADGGAGGPYPFWSPS